MRLLFILSTLVIALSGCSSAEDKALIEAAGRGDVPRIEQLLDEGANVNAIALDDLTPLTAAASAGHIEAVKLLVARGGDVNKPRGDLTPLFFAARDGHVEVVRFLLKCGARLDLPEAVRERFIQNVNSKAEIMSLISAQIK